MNRDYLLGVLTLPALAVAVIVGWLVWHAVGGLIVRALRRVPFSRWENRARFGAACASSRRAHTLGVGSVAVVLLIGLDHEVFARAHPALLTALRPDPAPPSSRWGGPS